jgi:hypothetical protein
MITHARCNVAGCANRWARYGADTGRWECCLCGEPLAHGVLRLPPILVRGLSLRPARHGTMYAYGLNSTNRQGGRHLEGNDWDLIGLSLEPNGKPVNNRTRYDLKRLRAGSMMGRRGPVGDFVGVFVYCPNRSCNVRQHLDLPPK